MMTRFGTVGFEVVTRFKRRLHIKRLMTMSAAAQTAPSSHRTAVLAIILVSYLMMVFDISIVITALPKIHDGLGFSAAGLSWVQNAYTLASGLVNMAHQLGGSLGLGVLVAVFATASGGVADVRELLVHRVATSLVVGTVMLAVALVLVVGLIVRRRTAAEAELPDLVEQRAS
jgi:hypothetical protein